MKGCWDNAKQTKLKDELADATGLANDDAKITTIVAALTTVYVARMNAVKKIIELNIEHARATYVETYQTATEAGENAASPPGAVGTATRNEADIISDFNTLLSDVKKGEKETTFRVGGADTTEITYTPGGKDKPAKIVANLASGPAGLGTRMLTGAWFDPVAKGIAVAGASAGMQSVKVTGSKWQQKQIAHHFIWLGVTVVNYTPSDTKGQNLLTIAQIRKGLSQHRVASEVKNVDLYLKLQTDNHSDLQQTMYEMLTPDERLHLIEDLRALELQKDAVPAAVGARPDLAAAETRNTAATAAVGHLATLKTQMDDFKRLLTEFHTAAARDDAAHQAKLRELAVTGRNLRPTLIGAGLTGAEADNLTTPFTPLMREANQKANAVRTTVGYLIGTDSTVALNTATANLTNAINTLEAQVNALKTAKERDLATVQTQHDDWVQTDTAKTAANTDKAQAFNAQATLAGQLGKGQKTAIYGKTRAHQAAPLSDAEETVNLAAKLRATQAADAQRMNAKGSMRPKWTVRKDVDAFLKAHQGKLTASNRDALAQALTDQHSTDLADQVTALRPGR